jgi:hypothetical protein
MPRVYRIALGLSSITFRFVFIAILTCAWLVIGVGGVVFPGAVRSVFYPFAEWFSRRLAVRVATFALVALLIVGAFLSLARPDRRPPAKSPVNKPSARLDKPSPDPGVSRVTK